MKLIKHGTSRLVSCENTSRAAARGRTACAARAFVGGLAALLPVVRADQIVVDGVTRAPVSIVDLQGGRLIYKSPEGVRNSEWLDNVQRITVDRGGRFLDFNEAERSFTTGDTGQAIARYVRVIRVSDSFWPDLIAARLVRACTLAGRLDQTALHFVRVLRHDRGGPPLAVRLIPSRLPERRDSRVVRAIEHLEGAMREIRSGDRRVPLELFRFALMQASGDRRTAIVARDVASLEISGPLHCAVAFDLQLRALEVMFRESPGEVPMPTIDRGIRDCPDDLLPGFLQMRGELLLNRAVTREDRIRAAWPFMRIVIHMPDHVRVPGALLGAARAMEAVGNWSKAMELLKESMAHPHLGDKTRAVVEQKMSEIQGTDSEYGVSG